MFPDLVLKLIKVRTPRKRRWTGRLYHNCLSGAPRPLHNTAERVNVINSETEDSVERAEVISLFMLQNVSEDVSGFSG